MKHFVLLNIVIFWYKCQVILNYFQHAHKKIQSCLTFKVKNYDLLFGAVWNLFAHAGNEFVYAYYILSENQNEH